MTEIEEFDYLEIESYERIIKLAAKIKGERHCTIPQHRA